MRLTHDHSNVDFRGHYLRRHPGVYEGNGQGNDPIVMEPDNWYYLAACFDKNNVGRMQCYLNGSQIVQTRWLGGISLSENVHGFSAGIWGSNAQGVIDEVRVRNVDSTPPSSLWVQAQYLSLFDQFITWGPEEAQGGGAAELIRHGPTLGRQLIRVEVGP